MKLDRALLDWEWFGDSNTVHVLIYLLLEVNWQPGKWQGIDIEPGSKVTSRAKIAGATGLSEKQVRLALERLEKSNVITRSGAGLGQLVTLVNWAKYQLNGEGEGRTRAGEKAGAGPDKGTPEGREKATIKEEKKLRREEGKKLSPIGERGARTSEQVEDVRNAFKAACKVVTDADPSRLVEKERKGFFAYWTEADKKGRLRFEDEKFFDHGRRMDTWMANANKRMDGGLFNGNASKAYGKAEAEAEEAAIRKANGRDPQWGPVYDNEMSPALIAYNKALMRTTK